jgi:hypothetical protein
MAKKCLLATLRTRPCFKVTNLKVKNVRNFVRTSVHSQGHLIKWQFQAEYLLGTSKYANINKARQLVSEVTWLDGQHSVLGRGFFSSPPGQLHGI